MLLTLTLSLFSQFTPFPQLLPASGPPQGGSVAASDSTTGGLAVIENFETYVVPVGSSELTGSNVIYEGTITGTGQGPGLVLPGCSYYCSSTGQLEWTGDSYFGLASKKLMASVSDRQLAIRYYDLQTSVNFNLHALDGFPDVARIDAFDGTGSLVASVGPISVPDSSPVPVTVSASSISRIEINGMAYPWSPIIDDHDYDFGTSCGLQLSITGPCPGVNTITINGGTPGNPCKLGYAFGLGSYVVPSGPCAGTTLGLDATATPIPGTWFFDGAGQIIFSMFIPPAACGTVFVQALEIGPCCTSNVVAL